jgi:bifunctional non-homologous end joining protein LigD
MRVGGCRNAAAAAGVGLLPEALGRVTHARPRSLSPLFLRGRGFVCRFEPTYLPADTVGMAVSIKGLPAGFIFPAQPVPRSKPPSGADWVHEIKHDGYRMIVSV